MPLPSRTIVVNENFIQQAEGFKLHLETLGHSAHGAKTKSRYLREFFAFLEGQGKTDLQQITAKEVNDYYSHIRQRPNYKTGELLSLKTCHHQMRSIELYFTMLQSQGKINIHPCSTLHFPYPTPSETERTVLTQSEIKALYSYCISYKEQAILSLAYGCGLRVGELTSCDIQDIRLSEKILIVPAGKGNKRRVVPMSKRVTEDLAGYFYHERDKDTEGRDYKPGEKAFMLHSRGGRMRKYTYNKILKKIIERTANPEITGKQISIHNLRHSIATHLLEQGMPVEQVRQFLGHSQLETTEIYTHISRKQLKKLVE